MLVRYNIIKGFFPNIEVNSSSSGNVFAYNFCYFPVSFNNGGIDILSNHSAHNHYNLYEGNVGKMLMSDGYFGSASEDTLFRNWLTGTGAVGDATHSVFNFAASREITTWLQTCSGKPALLTPGFLSGSECV